MSSIKDVLNLWPPSKHKEVINIFSGIELHENGPPLNVKNFGKCIAVLNGQPLNEVLRHLGIGYSHVIQKDREDFAFSLLSTALICKHPEAFQRDPLPFLFRSFTNGITDVKTNFIKLTWTDASQKMNIIDKAVKYFSTKAKTRPYRDIVAANLDELLTNARAVGSVIELPVILGVSQDRLCIAVADVQMKFDSRKTRERLWDVGRSKKFKPKPNYSRSGLGIPFVINNSTSFYLGHSPQGGGLSISLIDIRKGLRDLEQTPKNAHIF